MVNYKRLSDLEREEISRLLSQQCSFNNIAKALGRNVSTISREISAGSCNSYTYRAVKAHKRARRNAAKRKSGKYKIDGRPELWVYIHQKLNLIIRGAVLGRQRRPKMRSNYLNDRVIY